MAAKTTRTHTGIGPTGERVGENLARIREERRLTTAKLAKAMGEQGVPMNATTVTKIEKQDRRVTVDELVAFAVVLNVSPTLLLLPMNPPHQDREGSAGDRVSITQETSAYWETAWRWLHGQRPLHEASQRDNREFWWENRPYESDNPADEAAVVLNSRIQGAWHLELSRDEPGQLTRPGRGNLWEVPVDELHRLGRLPGGSAPERSGDQEGDVES